MLDKLTVEQIRALNLDSAEIESMEDPKKIGKSFDSFYKAWMREGIPNETLRRLDINAVNARNCLQGLYDRFNVLEFTDLAITSSFNADGSAWKFVINSNTRALFRGDPWPEDYAFRDLNEDLLTDWRINSTPVRVSRLGDGQ